MSRLIGLTGYARAGKDMLANHFVTHYGYTRLNLGDVIKRFFDPFTLGEISSDELELRITTRLYSESSEADLKEFMAEIACPYEAAGQAGISSFTELDAEKRVIRPILEKGGELIYGWIVDEYERDLRELLSQGDSVISTRVSYSLDRPQEANLIKRLGGLIVEVNRLDWPPTSPWENDSLSRLRTSQMIDLTVLNIGQSGDEWALQVPDTAELIQWQVA